MADGHKDYSGTPLWKKLGIAEDARVRVIGAPADFDRALGAIAPVPDGVTFLSRAGHDLDVVVLFVVRAAELERRFPPLVGSIATAGRTVGGMAQEGGEDGDRCGFRSRARHRPGRGAR